MMNWFRRVISSIINTLRRLGRTDRDTANLLDRYHVYLRSRISKVRILGEQMDRDLEQVFVDLIVVQQGTVEYSDLIAMMDTGMRRRLNPFSFNEIAASAESPQHLGRKLSPKDLLRKNIKAIITGAPGGGKTTLLKYLALESLATHNTLVVWFELKALTKGLFERAEPIAAETGNLILEELWLAYLTPQLSLTANEQNHLRDHWAKKLVSGELLVLMDGFDELQDEDLESSLNKCINQFVSALHNNTLLVATRAYAQRKLGAEGFEELQIEPLNDFQVAGFLNSYYPNDPAVTRLLNAVHERFVLRDLLNVPLLLGIILRLCRENKFIDDRLKLYELIISDLVRDLDRSKSVQRQFKIPDERLRVEFLKDLAFEQLLIDPLETNPHNNRLVFTYDALRRRAESFLMRQRLSHNDRELADDALATPLLRELSPDLFGFTQLTLQEYLAAQALAALYGRNEIDGLRVFCEAYYDSTVLEMEVLPMMLGASSGAEAIYQELENWSDSFTLANLRLRVKGLGYGAKISEDQHTKLLDRIWQVLVKPSNDEQAYSRLILNSLSALPDQARHYLEGKTIPFLNETRGFSNLRAVEALTVLGGKESFDPLVNALKSRRSDGMLIAGSFSGLNETFLHYASRALIKIDSDRAVEVLSRARTRYSYGDLDRLLKQAGTEESFRAIVLRQKTPTNIDWYTSKEVDEILKQSEESSIVKELIKALANTRAEIRRFAVDSLGIIGSEEAVAPIAERLSDSDFAVRWKAATALEYIGSAKAVGPLIQALTDEADTVRWCAASALGQIRSVEAVDALIQRLSDPDAEVQAHAASALGWIASEDAATPLLTLLTSGASPKARSAAAYAFYRIRNDRAVEVLISCLADPNVEVRAGAALALGGQQAAKASKPLIVLLHDPAEDVRANAAFALGRIRDEKAVPFLVFIFRNDQHPRVRENVIRALGQIGSENVVEPLVLIASSLFDSDRAVEALAQVKPSTFAMALPRLLKHAEKRVRRKALETITYYCDGTDLLSDFTALHQTDAETEVRVEAKRAADQMLRKLELLSRDYFGPSIPALLDNESREGILVGEVIRIVSEAGHIYREVLRHDWGIDGEIEFKNERGQASGQRVYLQLKSGDSYLYKRKSDGKEIFNIQNSRHVSYWQSQAYPVLLVIRAHGQTRFINVTEYLKARGGNVTQVEFQGEAFNSEAIQRMSVKFLSNLGTKF
jgi:HEAT repeat protein